MSRLLTEKVVTVVEPETKNWLRSHAAKLERTEGAVVRIALREYRAKVSKRKGEA